MQVELPWALGPPDGRYLLRAPDTDSAAPPTHVLVIRTLGAAERHRLKVRHNAQPEPEPVPVATGRATVIDVTNPLASSAEAEGWLGHAGEHDIDAGVAVLNRALHAFRLAAADPYEAVVVRRHLLVARVGYGGGDEVADGRWTAAVELIPRTHRRRRLKPLESQSRLSALLGGHDRALACEELALRARLDLDQGREREAALQLRIALDAALAELAQDPNAAGLAERLAELQTHLEPVAHASAAALQGPLPTEQRDHVRHALARLESALRARGAATRR